VNKLAALREEGAVEQAKKHEAAVNAAWRADLPFVSRTRYLVLGPSWSWAACAGKTAGEAACARTWIDWQSAPR